ncbi:helix-turn-helix domain-containing protein [Flavobacterium caseinilyticum]|uniref:Helix-turn-helix domain-containing protein n=1 Tax=Flavobacterium caseinilyticum TaxID=2541732 RepID=A0A4R5AXF7_9FLAO|nr:helix-turn-helix domain-containing protein [Flavobacterium caseinilyticum]TDD77255.1 helix-turn-helix domain-containing protein [Flavobacterium caseinilyticum]
MSEIKNIKCSEVTQNELKFAVYHTSDFLPFMQKLNIPHRHNYYMILLNEKNTGSQLIDFKESPIEPLSVTCMHYGQIHQWLDYDKIEGYILVFESDFFALRYQNYQLSEFSFLTYRHKQPYLKIAVEKFDRLKSIAIWMLNEYNGNETDYEKSLRSLLNLLLIDLNRLFEPIPKNTEFSQSLQLVHHFEELIDKYYKQKHFVKDYASIMYIRPNYLNSVCNDVVNISAGELIRNRILLEAKRLLIHEQKTVAEIAYELGFEDNSYFGRFFKKYENITPDAFKRKFINTSQFYQI